MRRHSVVLLATVLALLVSCTAGEAATSDPNTLEVGLILHGGQFLELVEQTAQDFEKLHPGVTVEVLSLPAGGDYYEKIPALAMAGSLPDIFPTGSRERTSLVNAGILADLSQFIKQDPKILNSLLPPLRQAIQIQGRYCGLPLSMEVWSTQFNRDYFQDSGISQPDQLYETGEWNFGALETLARKLTVWNADGTVARIGLYTNADNEVSFPWVWGMNQRIFSEDGRQVYLDRPAVLEGYRFFNSLINENRFANIVNTAWGVGWNGFVTGKWAMSMWWTDILTLLGGDWSLPYSYDALPFPAGPKSKVTNLITLWTWSMSAQSTKKALAWEFMKVLASPSFDHKLLETGQGRWPLTMDSIRFAQENLNLAYGITNARLLFDAVGRYAQVWSAPITQRATNTLTSLLYPVFEGKAPLETTLVEAQRQISEILR